MLVESLVNKELPPGRGAIGVESLITHDLLFSAEEKTRVRIYEQQRVTALRVRGCDSEAVGALWIEVRWCFGMCQRGRCRHRCRLVVVEGPQRVQVDALDVAANAALREA